MANKKMNPLDEKFKKDELKFEPVKNKDLVCKDCVHKYDDTKIPGNVSKCKIYKIKPMEVFNGGMCFDFKKSQE